VVTQVHKFLAFNCSGDKTFSGVVVGTADVIVCAVIGVVFKFLTFNCSGVKTLTH